MTDSFAAINGLPLAGLKLHVPARGAWFLDADFEDDAGQINPGDACTLTVRGSSAVLVGRAMPEHTGTRALQRKLRMLAGFGGWGVQLGARDGYHNDAGIKALSIANEVAALVGEEIGNFKVEKEKIGVDYARFAGPASRALEQVIGNSPWYVDYSGVTQVQERASSVADPKAYEVADFNPRTHICELYVDTLDALNVGSVISARLDTTETIRSFDITLDATRLRMRAYCGPTFDSPNQIETLIRKIVERVIESKGLRGAYRYRVAGMNTDGRVNLELVSGRTGAPGRLPLVEMWPGVAGIHAELPPGGEVLVEFADDGDPTLPVITHFRGKQSGNFLPVSLEILGKDLRAARQGDLCLSGGPGTQLALTLLSPVPVPGASPIPTGTPIIALVSFDAIPPTPATAAQLAGAIASGFDKVKFGA